MYKFDPLQGLEHGHFGQEQAAYTRFITRALGLRQTWIVPVAAIVYLAAGFEPLEEHRLLEVFGDEYAEYRRSVPRWFPRDAD